MLVAYTSLFEAWLYTLERIDTSTTYSTTYAAHLRPATVPGLLGRVATATPESGQSTRYAGCVLLVAEHGYIYVSLHTEWG
jgi:hypothetical protein